ncbi:hypothetical protein E4L96_04920 [Massilia arenosa]|uniref:Rap1a immunity protein domain-containing protein n=1 Tax=Zemynaea arenosa TaxID=2561931 RepID=A0A4Y9SMX0_9BURK|nr:Rap1a/Tai family immunity protein [Massilia arenosa]TFW25793.1 hypothetical protein E4L96_04920 [Massilia arenosa]
MLRHFIPTLFAAHCSTAAQAGDLSTRELVQRLTGEGQFESTAEYFAKGYLDGLIDATEGTYWCIRPNLRTDHEFDIELLHQLKAEPAYASSSAELAVTTGLSRRYPCASTLPHPVTPRQTPSVLRTAMSAPSASNRGHNLRAMSDGYITAVIDIAQLGGDKSTAIANRAALNQQLLKQSPPSRKSAADWILTVLRARPRAQGD